MHQRFVVRWLFKKISFEKKNVQIVKPFGSIFCRPFTRSKLFANVTNIKSRHNSEYRVGLNNFLFGYSCCWVWCLLRTSTSCGAYMYNIYEWFEYDINSRTKCQHSTFTTWSGQCNYNAYDSVRMQNTCQLIHVRLLGTQYSTHFLSRFHYQHILWQETNANICFATIRIFKRHFS